MTHEDPRPEETDESGPPAVAIVGMACRFPGAATLADFWELLQEGKDAYRPIPEEELRRLGVPAELAADPRYVAGRQDFPAADRFDAAFFGMSAAEAEITDPQQRLLLETAHHALENAAIDPERFGGDISVHVGLNISTYLLENLLGRPEECEKLGWHRVFMGNDRGYTSTQISYRLGLTGPSLAVDSACSSGLAAVHLACRSLLAYETDAALAGGASVKARDAGYLHLPGGIASSDGRCRPFSADSTGTVFASGVGMVVLRRLEDAIADGDRIYAVIRSSAMNNDGSAKSGYTAPSQEGQARLISTALDLADVDADAVSYVEAHGTGTNLGDPIEIAGLTEAFRATTDRTGFCAVGSVKSNIGHLDSAAGIAGLIKTALSVHHGQLPATAHFTEPNPHIDFAGSPFYVNDRLRAWPQPRLAGVSSFGVGGTNVHVLVGEAPREDGAVEGSVEDAPAYPLLFSAKSAQSCDLLGDALTATAAGASAEQARDIAFTLVRGRAAFPHRGATLWTGSGAVRVGTSAPGAPARVIAVLPAVGAVERERFARRYAADPDYRRVTDHWCREVRAVGGAELTAFFTSDQLLAEPHLRAGAELALLASAEQWQDLGVRFGGVATPEPAGLATAWLAWGTDRVRCARAIADIAAGQEASPVRPGGTPELPVIQDAPTAGSGDLLLDLGATGSAASAGAGPTEADAVPAAGTAADLCRLWLAGADLDLDRCAEAMSGRVADLPGYPFEDRRYWVEAASAMTGAEATGPAEDVAAGQAEDVAAGPAVDVDPVTAALAAFREVLGDEDIEPDDDLFELGGDSLLAIRMLANLRGRLGVDIPLGTFLDDPTPASTAALIAELVSVPALPAAPVDALPDGPLPLSYLQRRFFFMDQLETASSAYNVPLFTEIRGRLDAPALRLALADTLRRHPGLRMTYRLENGEPVQEPVEAAEPELPVVEVAETELRTATRELLRRTVPLDRAPNLRAVLLRVSAEHHVLALVFHHICVDQRSLGLVLRDLFAYYQARTEGAPVEAAPLHRELARYLSDQRDWLATPAAQEQLAFWTERLAGAPATLALPTDRPRGSAQTYNGGKLDFHLGPDTLDALRLFAKEEQTTPFVVMLSAFQVLLSRLSGQRDLVVGTPVSGRTAPGADQLVGNFANTVALRAAITMDQSFRALVRDSRKRVLEAFDHCELPFELLVEKLSPERNLSAAPIYQVLFNMLSIGESATPQAPGLALAPVPFDKDTSPFELSLDWWLDSDGVRGRFLYNTDLFDRTTVQRWSECLDQQLRDFLAAPDAALLDHACMPEHIRTVLDGVLRGEEVPVDARAVHEIVLQRAVERPHALAVDDGAVSLSYERLAHASAAVARILTERGVRPGDVVGLAMARSSLAVCVLLGTLRAGATTVPLELNHPESRLAALVADAEPRLVLCDSAEDVPFCAAELVAEVGGGVLDAAVEEPYAVLAEPAEIAYLTYTSGTTGRPKGIEFPHRALTNLIQWETDGFRTPRRYLQFASFGFDASFHELFGALCAGGSVHVADEETKHDHEALAAFVSEHRVEKAIFPVSLLHALAGRYQDDAEAFRSLREVASTGEQLRVSQVLVNFFERLPDCRLINNYGPAETHVVTSYRFHGPARTWPRYAPIGRPLPNVALSVVDAEGQDTLFGAVGELLIAGICVARGYRNREDLTARSFGDGPRTGERAYRSGDLVRVLPSGDIEYRGRGDQQVKIRGFRVEPAEIEIAVRRDPRVRNVAVAVRGEAGDRRLHAYLVVGAGDGEAVLRDTRTRLRAELPGYMVPSSFTLLGELPVNANGKVDFDRLPALEARPKPGPVGEASTDPLLDEVSAVFAEVLGHPVDGPEANFFDEGGHSLLATALLHEIHSRFGVRVTVRAFFGSPTAAEVARLVGAARPGEETAQQDEDLPEIERHLPLGAAAKLILARPAEHQQKSFVFEVIGELDPVRLERAFGSAMHQHTALRTRITRGEDGTAFAEVAESGNGLEVRILDSVQPTPEQLQQWEQERWIDPSSGPLLKVALVPPSRGRGLLAVTVHLLVLDGIGLGSLLESVAEFYAGRTDLGEPDDGFQRYLLWQDRLPESRRDQAAAKWRELLGGPERQPEPFGPAPRRLTPATRRGWEPDASLQDALRKRCSAAGTTPFVLHLTAFGLAAAAAYGTDRAMLTVAVDGRPNGSLRRTVGGFANSVPFVVPAPSDASAADVLRRVEESYRLMEDVRTVPWPTIAGHEAERLPAVHFGYARVDDDSPWSLGGAVLPSLPVDTVQPGQRVFFRVADRGARFGAGCWYAAGDAGLPGDRDLIGRYRENLYALLFDPQQPIREVLS